MQVVTLGAYVVLNQVNELCSPLELVFDLLAVPQEVVLPEYFPPMFGAVLPATALTDLLVLLLA